MGFFGWIFGRKKKEKKESVEKAVEDMHGKFKQTADWIKHLHTRDSHHELSLSEIDSRLSTLEEDVGEIKTFMSFFGKKSTRLFKQRQTPVYKQRSVQAVQTPVQTFVQNEFLRNLSVMERAIVWVLLNTEMKLSYEDIAALLGKDRATIRGQVNSIRQKSEGLVEEVIEKNNKKRVFINEGMKELLLKSLKPEEKRKKKVKSED